MRYLLFVVAFIIALPCLSQKLEAFFKILPLRNGILYEVPRFVCFGNQQDGVILTSNNESCFATTDGVVARLFNLGEGELAATINCNGTFVTYASRMCLNVSQGDTIKAGILLEGWKEMTQGNLNLFTSWQISMPTFFHGKN